MSWFSRIVEAGTKAVAAVATHAKKAACRAIDFMANHAEAYVGKVKALWKSVKPYVKKAQAPLALAAKAAATTPYVGAAMNTLAAGVTALLALENSEVMKGIERAVMHAVGLAKTLEAQIKAGEFALLTPEEYAEAVNSRGMFRKAEPAASPEQRRQLDLVAAVTDLGLARADLQQAIDGEPGDFIHYLRLRATQKLLREQERKLLNAGSVEALTDDDRFVIRVASDLIKADPSLDSAAAERLDTILRTAHGKTLQSFVFEELVASWKRRADDLAGELEKATRALASSRVRLRQLETARTVQGELDSGEAAELAGLQTHVPGEEAAYGALATEKADVARYADAAEGFLQLLEKAPDQLEAEDLGYVVEDGAEVGAILQRVAEQALPFAALSTDEQALIVDFANIFHAAARARMQAVLEVTA